MPLRTPATYLVAEATNSTAANEISQSLKFRVREFRVREFRVREFCVREVRHRWVFSA